MSSSAAATATASSAFALTTTFTPATACTQSHWTMLPPQSSYFVYLNYPDPLPQSTFSECYPPEFLSSYYQQKTELTPLPTIAPLICPKGYHSVSVAKAPDGYVACCPSGMNGIATSAQAPYYRPAFNGTCYSDVEKTLWVTAWGTDSISTTSMWSAPAGAQAYALPIEGYAFVMSLNTAEPTGSTGSTASPASSPTSNVASATSASATPSQTNGSGAQNDNPTTTKSTSHTGAIVGGVVGGVAGLALIFLAIWWFFIRKRKDGPKGRAPELSAESPWQRTELGEKEEDKPWDQNAPHSPSTHHELDGTENAMPVELDAARNSMYKYDRSVV